MRVWKSFLSYCQKGMGQWSFWGAMALLCLLCFTSSSAVVDSVSYSVLECLLRFPLSQRQMDLQFAALYQFQSGMGTYSRMFVPLLAALPTVPLFCRERTNGALRFILPRSGRTGCALGFWLAALFCGGLVVFGGYALFGLCCLLLFPSGAAYGLTAGLCLKLALPYLAGAFLLGAGSVSLSVALCAFSRNPYQVLCGSFTLQYALSTFCTRAGLTAPAGWRYLLIETVEPGAAFDILRLSGPLRWTVPAFQLLLTLAAAGVFRLCLGRRLDCGT